MLIFAITDDTAASVICHSTKKPVTTMLTYPWKCTVLHCNHLENTWKPLVLMTRHFDYCPSASESSAPVVSRCFPGDYNVKLYISRGRLAWWLLAFLHSVFKKLLSSFSWASAWTYEHWTNYCRDPSKCILPESVCFTVFHAAWDVWSLCFRFVNDNKSISGEWYH